MIRRVLRIAVRVGVVAGAGAAVAKALQGRRQPGVGTMPSGEPPVPTGPPKSSQPLVEPDMFKDLDLRKSPSGDEAGEAGNGQVGAAAAADRLWVEPDGAVCPSSHPVKAKLSSSIFHLPGMTAYERTTPDRCYRDAAAAEADGLRPAKR